MAGHRSFDELSGLVRQRPGAADRIDAAKREMRDVPTSTPLAAEERGLESVDSGLDRDRGSD